MHLTSLPLELQLRIANALDDPHDCASLCLALPPLGCAALKELPKYGRVLVSVALQLAQASAYERKDQLSEGLLRRYAALRQADLEGVAWLNKTHAKARSELRIDVTEPRGQLTWALPCGAQLRFTSKPSGTVVHFRGEYGKERKVRVALPDGTDAYYEGEKGKERMVRTHLCHYVCHYEGVKDEERIVRTSSADGMVIHYDGAEGRMVRTENNLDGSILYYEGAQGEERMIRTENLDGTILHYEGAQAEERVIRTENPDGTISNYQGAQGEEQVVGTEHVPFPCLDLMDCE